MNIYARTRDAFDEDAQQIATHLAGYAAVAMINASLYVSTATLSEQLQQALDSRPIIEQAKGILMGERRCSAEEAFAVLAEISLHANRKLSDVATALVEQAHPSPDIRGAK